MALLPVPAVELLAMLGFKFVASVSTEQGLRYLPFLAAAVAVVYLAMRSAGSMTLRQIAVWSVLTSLLLVLAFQGLGLVFGGQAKDLDPLSFANVVRLAVALVIATVAHAALLVACHLLRKPSG